jgi:hypothetical protein
MKAALAALLSGTNDLRHHIGLIQTEWALIAAKTASPHCSQADELAAELQRQIGTGAAKRQFDYNSAIISLYGLLEQFVEALVRAYAESLNRLVQDYSALPEPLRNSHIDASFTLLTRIELARYRGVITREQVIANLHSCLSNARPYRLNAEAFAYHTANFRVGVIDATLARLGLQGVSQRLRHYPAFAAYLGQAFPAVDPLRLTADEMFETLNDLADRRNEVAHGQPNQLLSNNILLDYVAYVEAYCTSMEEAVSSDIVMRDAQTRAIDVGAPIAVYNDRIVCLELKNTPIKVGDILIAQTGNTARPVIAGEILEIQVNNAPLKTVAAAPSVKIGARVGYRTKDTHTFLILPA